MIGSCITNTIDLFNLREKSYYYYEKGGAYFFPGVQYGSHFLSDSLDKIIQQLTNCWDNQPGELQEKLYTIWEKVKNSPTTPEDTLCCLVQKVAFAALISLPVALVIYDFINNSENPPLPQTVTLRACFDLVFKGYLYAYAMRLLIDFAYNYCINSEIN